MKRAQRGVELNPRVMSSPSLVSPAAIGLSAPWVETTAGGACRTPLSQAYSATAKIPIERHAAKGIFPSDRSALDGSRVPAVSARQPTPSLFSLPEFITLGNSGLNCFCQSLLGLRNVRVPSQRQQAGPVPPPRVDVCFQFALCHDAPEPLTVRCSNLLGGRHARAGAESDGPRSSTLKLKHEVDNPPLNACCSASLDLWLLRRSDRQQHYPPKHSGSWWRRHPAGQSSPATVFAPRRGFTCGLDRADVPARGTANQLA